MSWLWSSGGGTGMFDIYSIQHAVWFIAITLLLTPVFAKKTWRAVLAVAFFWEVFEYWVAVNILWFPFAGKEEWINKLIGDPISNLVGFGIAILCIKEIRKLEHE